MARSPTTVTVSRPTPSVDHVAEAYPVPPSIKAQRVAGIILIALAAASLACTFLLPWQNNQGSDQPAMSRSDIEAAYGPWTPLYERTWTSWPLWGAAMAGAGGLLMLLFPSARPNAYTSRILGIVPAWIGSLLLALGAARLLGSFAVEAMKDTDLVTVPAMTPYANLLLGLGALVISTMALFTLAADVIRLPTEPMLKRAAVRLPTWTLLAAAATLLVTPLLSFASEADGGASQPDPFGEHGLAQYHGDPNGVYGDFPLDSVRTALADAGQHLGWARMALWGALGFAFAAWAAALAERQSPGPMWAWANQVHIVSGLLGIVAAVFAVLVIASLYSTSDLRPGYNYIPILGSLTILAFAVLHILKVTSALLSQRGTATPVAPAPPAP